MSVVERPPRLHSPEVEILQGGIVSLRHAEGHLLAALAREYLEIDALTRFMKKAYGTEREPYVHHFGATVHLTFGEGLKYFTPENPGRTGSPGAESVYSVMGIFGNCIFLIQFMDIDSRASWHTHGPGEHFINRDGRAFIYEKDDIVYPVGAYRYLEPDKPHMIYTLDEPAFNIIVHEGTDFDHAPYPGPRPSISVLRDLTTKAGLNPWA